MKELIFLVKDLISKIKSDSATLLDYINTLDAILHFLREFISGPVIGENPMIQNNCSASALNWDWRCQRAVQSSASPCSFF